MRAGLDNSLQNIIDNLSSHKISLFCGAGISYNSGLPIVYQFIESILIKFELSEDEKKAIHNSGFPFEAFVELLQKECETDELLTIFRKGKFNTNHLFLAYLIKVKKTKNIITTNFDEHIEHACSFLDLKENTDFKIYRTEKEFADIDWTDESIKLIKIHGCVSDLKSMAVNMRMVANKTDSENKNAAIRNFFNSTYNPLIFILGYSCSDVFDISPVIESLENSLSEIILLEHVTSKEDQRSEDIQIQPNKNPFTMFSGKRVFVPTDIFVELLWNNYKFPGYSLLIHSSTDWQQNIDDWYEYVVAENTKGFRHHICSRFFYDIGEYSFSENHYNKGIATAFELGEYQTVASEIGNLGLNYNALAQYTKAKDCLNTSLDLYRKIGDTYGEMIHLQSLGNVYRNEGNYQLAEKFILQSLKFPELRKHPIHACTGLGNLALVYNLTGNYKKAIECAEKGKEIADELGIKQSEGSQTNTLAMVHYQLGNVEKSMSLFIESIKIMRQMRDQRSEAGALNNLARIYTEQGNINKSMECLLEALPIAKKLGILQFEGLTYFNMAHNYSVIKHRENALLYFKLALEIFKEVYPENHPDLIVAADMVAGMS